MCHHGIDDTANTESMFTAHPCDNDFTTRRHDMSPPGDLEVCLKNDR